MKKALLYFMAALLCFCLILENFRGDSSWRQDPLLGEDGVYTKFVDGINGFGDWALSVGRNTLTFILDPESVDLGLVASYKDPVSGLFYTSPFAELFVVEGDSSIYMTVFGWVKMSSVSNGAPGQVFLWSSSSLYQSYPVYKFLRGYFVIDVNGVEHKVISRRRVLCEDYDLFSSSDFSSFLSSFSFE